MYTKHMQMLILSTLSYLAWGTYVFLGNANLEFVIYVAVIIAIFAGTLVVHRYVQFPLWMLWALSLWGLLHVAGGAVVVGDHVLFAHHIFPLIDLGGEFYILKYDQVVHGYLYGLVAVMAQHVLVHTYKQQTFLTALVAVLVSFGISGLNEIMEFFISLTMENGVGGYENTMLDMCFNLGGALVAASVCWLFTKKKCPCID